MNDLSQTYRITVKLIQEKLLVNGLKQVLKQLNLSSTGRKAFLQSRLIDYVTTGYRRHEIDRVETVRHLVEEELARSAMSKAAGYNAFSTPRQAEEGYNRQIMYPSIPMTNSNMTIPETRPPDALRVNFKLSPFYTLVKVLCEPFRLPITIPTMPHNVSCSFSLNPQEVEAIENKSYSILLMSAVTSELSQFQTLPIEFSTQIEIRVNKQQVIISGRGLKNKPGTAKPQNITPFVQNVVNAINRIDIAAHEASSKYVMAVHLVKNVSIDTLVDQIIEKDHISKQSTINKIVEETDEDVKTLSTVLSLRCPLSFSRLTIPVRSVFCDHIECFEARSFFELQQQATTWTCPICNKSIDYRTLAVDDYLLEIVEKTKIYDLDEIEIKEDGSWVLPENTLLLDDNDENSSGSEDSNETSKKSVSHGKSVNPIVIDLLDSDEEDNTDTTEYNNPSGDLNASYSTSAPPAITNSSAPSVSQSPFNVNLFPVLSSNSIQGQRTLPFDQGNEHSITSPSSHINGNSDMSPIFKERLPLRPMMGQVFDTPLPDQNILQQSQESSQSQQTQQRSHQSLQMQQPLQQQATLPLQQRQTLTLPLPQLPMDPKKIYESLPDWDKSLMNRFKKTPSLPVSSTTPPYSARPAGSLPPFRDMVANTDSASSALSNNDNSDNDPVYVDLTFSDDE